MTLNWFSPLPPARSGIAQYTVSLLPALRRHADVVLWTDQAGWDPALEQLARVRRYAPERVPWDELNRADANVFQIGNHPSFHSSILAVCQRQPGIVVLHDRCLQHLIVASFQPLDDRDGYLELMRRHYGAGGAAAGDAFWSGRCSIDDMAERYPLSEPAIGGALGIVVHTPDAYAGLAASRRPVAQLALPYPAAAPVRLPRPRRPPYRIVAFAGGPSRRLSSLLASLAELPERDRFRLSLYGECADADVPQRLRALGLQRLVTLHGYVDSRVMDVALADADLAVNLRYPTMGEASLSQLQIWDHRLPSLVSRDGWYASLPADAVAFVRPEHERADIQSHLRAFLADAERFARMGERGRQVLERQHTPDAYAGDLVAFIGEAYANQTAATGLHLAARAGALLGEWLPPNTDTLHNLSQQIHHLTRRE